MRVFLGFVLVMGLVIGVAALACTLFYDGPEADAAIVTSAGVAFTVQVLTFALARAFVPTNLMAGWGAGILVRFGTLILHGAVGVKLLGQPAEPALVSLAAFIFLTTFIEPFFLTRPANSTLRATQ